MNKTAATAVATCIGGAFVLFSTHGAKFFEALGALPILLDQWTGASMLGVWSLLAGVGIPCLAWLALDRWLPHFPNKHTRMVLIEVLVGLGGFGIVFLLLPTLPGLLLGIGCGLLAPLPARGINAVGAFIRRRSGPQS